MATSTMFRRAPAACRTLAALAAVALLLPACDSGEDDRNENQIKPVRASLSIDPVTDPTVVYFKENSVSEDLVLIDVMLRTDAPLTFYAFTLEIHYVPGLVHLGGDFTSSPFTGTPFGTCGQCVGRCDATPCVKCEDCLTPATLSDQSLSPLCGSNGPAADGSGILSLAASISGFLDPGASETRSGCPAFVTVPAGEFKLTTLGFVATTIGTSRIELYTNPNAGQRGDCEILRSDPAGPVVDLGIPCNDGNATITGSL